MSGTFKLREANETTIEQMNNLIRSAHRLLDAKYDECSIYSLDEEFSNLLSAYTSIQLDALVISK